MTDPAAAVAREKAREIAQATAAAVGYDTGSGKVITSINSLALSLEHSVHAALLAAEQRGRDAAVPAGWRLVPVEATSDLLAKLNSVKVQPTAGYWHRVYDALIAAAPQPKESGDE